MKTHQDQSTQRSRAARGGWLLGCLTLCFTVSGALWPAARAFQNTREVRIANTTAATGSNVTVSVELVAQGNENALGFSLTFNNAILTNPQVAAGSAAPNVSPLVNGNQVSNGRLGIVIALPANQVFPAGIRQVATVTFTIPANAPLGATTIGFGDQPIARELSDPIANALTASFTSGTVTINALAVSVSAASFVRDVAAAEMIVALFGTDLATEVKINETLPLPTTLAGTTVKVRDSAGTERNAPLYFVSPGQINYLVPPGTANGAATLTITAGNNKLSSGTLNVQAVAPGLFAANANGQGVPAAVLFRLKADGQQSLEAIAQPQGGVLVATPIDLGPAGDQTYLILFGTGFRGRSSQSAVAAQIGGANVDVPFAGAQGALVGLDQMNVGPLPRSLAGRGNVNLVIIVDGKNANTMQVNFK